MNEAQRYVVYRYSVLKDEGAPDDCIMVNADAYDALAREVEALKADNKAKDVAFDKLDRLRQRTYEYQKEAERQLAEAQQRIAAQDRELNQLEARCRTVSPTFCGTNPILPTDRVGCGREIFGEPELYRCTHCSVPFHRECLKQHCKDELGQAEARLAEVVAALHGVNEALKNGDGESAQHQAEAALAKARP